MAELTVYEGFQALAEKKADNYVVTSPLTNKAVELERGVDFDVIKGTSQPSLLKPGAEKIVSAYGLLVHYDLESKLECAEVEEEDNKGETHRKYLFFYNVKCELVKVANNGTEYVFSSGYGSANTAEKRNGWNKPWDSANATLKMAQKRALVQAALSVSGLSSLFSQDIENESFMAKFDELNNAVKNGTITQKQGKLIFATAANIGISPAKLKTKLKEWGYEDVKKIQQSEIDDVLQKINSLKEE